MIRLQQTVCFGFSSLYVFFVISSNPLEVISPSVTLPTICLSNTHILHSKTMSNAAEQLAQRRAEAMCHEKAAGFHAMPSLNQGFSSARSLRSTLTSPSNYQQSKRGLQTAPLILKLDVKHTVHHQRQGRVSSFSRQACSL